MIGFGPVAMHKRPHSFVALALGQGLIGPSSALRRHRQEARAHAHLHRVGGGCAHPKALQAPAARKGEVAGQRDGQQPVRHDVGQCAPLRAQARDGGAMAAGRVSAGAASCC